MKFVLKDPDNDVLEVDSAHPGLIMAVNKESVWLNREQAITLSEFIDAALYPPTEVDE